MKIKRLISLILILSMALAFAGCNKKEKDDTITMFIGLGNTSSGYYTEFAKALKEETGIDIKFVYYNTKDTTNSIAQRIKNYDLPADIVITGSATDKAYQQEAFLDLSIHTNVTDLFTMTFLDSNDIDGSIYQIPFSTRLIGIQYNKTLFEELGWELPNDFEDMCALKKKADALGIKFAVSAGAATGHGFNYLFHLMGTDYLATPSGNQWFFDYRDGKATVDSFKEQSSYFQKYAEAGLFGEVDTVNWNANTTFSETRALFYYNIINNAYSYHGFQYNDDGTIVGATYNDDGTIVANKADDGIAVCVNDKFVLYDETNADHKGLQRYNIPGAKVLNDEYGSMPWISEDGSCNCYTTYNNMYVALDKALGEKGNEAKLDKATKVLEFMASDKAIKIFTDLYEDGYVGTQSFSIDETRLYYNYANLIKQGYLQDWWYNYFDVDSIMGVGQLVNDYLCNKPGVTFNSIMTELDKRNTEYLNKQVDVVCIANETLDYEDVAKLECIASGMATQKALDAAGIKAEVTVSIMPYADSIENLPLETPSPIVPCRIYKGEIETSLMNAFVAPITNYPIVVKMTGAQIKEIIKTGYNTNEIDGVDHTFNYAYLVKGGVELKNDAEYYVAVPANNNATAGLNNFESYLSAGKVVMKDNEPVYGVLTESLLEYFESVDSVSKTSLLWK